MTSRIPELDLIELIGHLIAYASHIQECIVANEDADPKLLDIYNHVVNDRRSYMRLLQDKENTKPELWCAVKHAIAARQYATEVYQATEMDTTECIEFELLINSTANLASILSMYLDVEYTECLRCLQDKLK